jgi:hypothetical protein
MDFHALMAPYEDLYIVFGEQYFANLFRSLCTCALNCGCRMGEGVCVCVRV